MPMILAAVLAVAAAQPGAPPTVCWRPAPAPMSPHADPLKGYVPLGDAELRRLLVDQGGRLYDLSRRPPAMFDANYREEFRRDGTWVISGGRAGGLSGRYEIRRGELCTQRPRDGGTWRCRVLWRDGRGRYLAVEGGGPSHGLTLASVAIGPGRLCPD